MPPKKWEVPKKQQEGGVTKLQFCLSRTRSGKFVVKITHLRFVTTLTVSADVEVTDKDIYAASSNATSSCRLCKSVGDSAHCKNLFGKANRVLLVAAEEIYGSSLHRSELLLHLL